MPITLKELVDQGIEFTLGGELGAEISSATLVNRAGRALFRMHQWNFREQSSKSIPLVTGQDHVILPADFGTMVAIHMTDNLNGTVRLVTPREMGMHRATSVIASSSHYWACVVSGGPMNQRWRLELYPTPTSEDTLQVWYRNKWLTLENDDDVANCPDFVVDLLIELIAAYAIGYQERGKHLSLSAVLKEIRAGEIFRAASVEDGMTQTELGPIVGGAVEPRGISGIMGGWAPYNTVTDPT